MPRSESLTVSKLIEKLKSTARLVQRRRKLKSQEESRVDQAFELLANSYRPHIIQPSYRKKYIDFLQVVHELLGASKVALCAIAIGPAAITSLRDQIRVDLPFEMKLHAEAMDSDILQNLVHGVARRSFPISDRTNDKPKEHMSCQQARRVSMPQGLEHVTDPYPAGQGVVGLSPASSFAANADSAQSQPRSLEILCAEQQVSGGVLPAAFPNSGRVFELTTEDVQDILDTSGARDEILLTEPFNVAILPFVTVRITEAMCARFINSRRQVL